jgi:hypothetical protein
MFHGVHVGDNVYKVEVLAMMLPSTTLMFLDSKDDPPQFTLWEGASTQKLFPSNVWHAT